MTMKNCRLLAFPSYFVAFSLVSIPLLDTALSVWPLRIGEVAWRFGVAGLFSRAIMTPALGLFIAFATALFLDHRRLLQVFSVLNALAASLVVLGLGLFVLDAVQLRVQVNPQMKTAFDISTMVALGKLTLSIALMFGFAVVAHRAAKQIEMAKRPRKTPQTTGTVGLIAVSKRTPTA
jgi:hypothetical protein